MNSSISRNNGQSERGTTPEEENHIDGNNEIRRSRSIDQTQINEVVVGDADTNIDSALLEAGVGGHEGETNGDHHMHRNENDEEEHLRNNSDDNNNNNEDNTNSHNEVAAVAAAAVNETHYNNLINRHADDGNHTEDDHVDVNTMGNPAVDQINLADASSVSLGNNSNNNKRSHDDMINVNDENDVEHPRHISGDGDETFVGINSKRSGGNSSHNNIVSTSDEEDDEEKKILNKRGRKPIATTGTEAWKQQRKESHKEVERRRRENINMAINSLSTLLPVKESSKAAILSRAAEYIQKLKKTENANIEKWTLQKLLSEQNSSQLSIANEKLQEELGNAYKEIEYMRRILKKNNIDYKEYSSEAKETNE